MAFNRSIAFLILVMAFALGYLFFDGKKPLKAFIVIIMIISADENEHQKAKQAMPGKVGILVE